MRGAMLFAAGLFAGLAVSVGLAQNANSNVVMMNHVGINVPDIPAALTYYTETMGYREAFRLSDDNGRPRLVYLHISNNTFLELGVANAERPAGFTHYGLHVENVADAVASFRRNGATVSDTRNSDTKRSSPTSLIPTWAASNWRTPPESLHYQAIQSWN